MAAPRYIAVMNYHTGALIYVGTGEWRAAECLEPGTVFGTGSSEASATAHAMREMAKQCETVQS